MTAELGFESLEDLAAKIEWEGGAAAMVDYCGLGKPETVGPLNELADGLGDAFAKLYEGVKEIDTILEDFYE